MPIAIRCRKYDENDLPVRENVLNSITKLRPQQWEFSKTRCCRAGLPESLFGSRKTEKQMQPKPVRRPPLIGLHWLRDRRLAPFKGPQTWTPVRTLPNRVRHVGNPHATKPNASDCQLAPRQIADTVWVFQCQQCQNTMNHKICFTD